MIIQARCMNCDEVTAEADLSKPCPSKGWLVDGQWLFGLNPCCSGNEHTNPCIYLTIKGDDEE